MLNPPLELNEFCVIRVPFARMSMMPGPALSRTTLRLNTTPLPV
jgi:hypothetical protein